MEISSEYSGGLEDSMRAFNLAGSQMPENRREALMKQMEQGAGQAKLKSVDWGSPRDLRMPVKLTLAAEDYKGAGTSGQAVYATFSGFGGLPIQLAALVVVLRAEKNIPEAASRKEDYWLAGPFAAETRYRVVPPAGFRLRQLPDLKDLSYGPLTIARKATLQADGSVLMASHMSSERVFTVTQAKSLLEAVEKTPIGTYRVEFMPEGSLLMSQGKWKEGIELLRRDAQTDSATVATMLRYAGALLETGMRDDAIAMCRKAIERDPKSAAAYAQLALLYRYDPAGRLDTVGNDIGQAEMNIRKAMELAPDEKKLVADLATILEWKNPAERYADKDGLDRAIKALDGISKDLPGLGQGEMLPTALFRARRFSEVVDYYARPEANGGRTALHVAAVAAARGSAEAISEAQKMFRDEDTRRRNLTTAGTDLLAVGEYAKAADLYAEGSTSSSIPASDLEMLRRSHRLAEFRFSENGAVSSMQHYILSLCDPQSGFRYPELLVPEWRVLAFNTQRSQLLNMLNPMVRIGGVQPGSRAIGEIVVSTADLTADGSDEIGYRIRYADPSSGGQQKTLGWVVRRENAYYVLGLKGDQATSGGEALLLARRGDLAGARQWLDWEREEIGVPASADPLAAEGFTKLWPPRPAVPEEDQILAATSALAVRGAHFRDAADVLEQVRDHSQDSSFRNDIDIALAQGLSRAGEYGEAAPVWRRLRQPYPASETALSSLGLALAGSGQAEEALALAGTFRPTDALFASAQRAVARVLIRQHKYEEAAKAFKRVTDTRKAVASDYNNEAWLTLFSPGVRLPDLEAANTANRLTQNRAAGDLHTLSAVQAERGELRDARQNLVRYLTLAGPPPNINDAARYLMGRIAEGLGLRETATETYDAIAKPKVDTGDDVYALAQVRLKALRSSQ